MVMTPASHAGGPEFDPRCLYVCMYDYTVYMCIYIYFEVRILFSELREY